MDRQPPGPSKVPIPGQKPTATAPVTPDRPSQEPRQPVEALSPKGQYESDVLTLARLVQVGALSEGMLRWMAMYLRLQEAEIEGTELSLDDATALEFAQKAIITLPPATNITPRLRKPSPMQAEDEGRKRRRTRSESTSPRKATRHTSPSPRPLEAPKQPLALVSGQKPQKGKELAPSKPSFAEAAQGQGVKRQGEAPRPTSARPQAPRTTKAPTSGASSTANKTPQPPQPEVSTQPREGPRYPPLIVEKLENWSSHFKTLAAKLGRPPNGRPYGRGIRFNPEDEKEYRLIQSYLTELEEREKISWFSYSLPTERSLKVAIRGLPSDTDTGEISAALSAKGFEPEYVKNILGRQGKPGSVFYCLLTKTPNLIPAIYDVTELLMMPGVVIEAWRGKKGPAQCHRCQKFRHSSHNCHREQACVRCGESHRAAECPRPIEEPATCANCGGAHPANFKSCPVFKKEARNKRGGTIAETTTTTRGRKGTAPVAPTTVEETATASLMAEANMPGQKRGKAKKKKKPAKKEEEDRPPQTKRRDSLGQTISVIKEILEEVQSGTDAETAALRGLMRILNKNGGS